MQVDLRIYCFQASEPDSRPPPVAFSPPNAPPISAPEVGMLTLTMPQSDPKGPIHWNERKKREKLVSSNAHKMSTMSFHGTLGKIEKLI